MLSLKEVDIYYGVIPAVRGLSLDVGEGQIVALIGANGAGKSTTLKAIIGILHPKRGQVIYKGEDIIKFSTDKRVRSGLILVPEGREIFSELTVRENLMLGAYYRKDRDGIREDLAWVHGLFPTLKEREAQTAGTLSGGEQQMLAVGRGLMGSPELLLLDEPSLGLAPVLVREVYEAIQKINQAGITILLVEQDTSIALKVANYVYVLETGNLRLQGEPKDVAEKEDIRKAYLGG